MTLTALTDRHLVRAAQPETRHVLLTLTAPPPPKRANGKDARPPVNVCFVLDRSGSMAGHKIALARYAVDRAIDGLTGRDRFSVVVYDDQIEVIVDHAKATADAKHRAHVQLQGVDSRGYTALHGGWSRGS